MNTLTQKMLKSFSALDKRTQEEIVEIVQQKSLQQRPQNNHARIATVQKGVLKRVSVSNKPQKQIGTRTSFLNRTHAIQQHEQETIGQRMLQVLKEAGLVGCIHNGEKDLAENYEKYLWRNK